MYDETDLLKALKSSFQKYKEFGARSTQNIIPLHKYVSTILQKIWGDKYDIYFMSESSKEANVEGKYYSKDIDIAVFKSKTPIFCLGVKFITSNYKQNADNFFENMMGETANIQANQIPYAHIIIMRYETPYYKKNNSYIPEKIETIGKKDITKYLKLIYDTAQAHQPIELCIFLVNIDEKTYSVTPTNLMEVFRSDFAKLMNDKLSPINFFTQIENYKKYYELKK